mgnify:CR=1 FL=1
MKKSINELKQKFLIIKESGWIKGTGFGYNSVGITFEQLLGLSQNELEIADYNGIEIKTKRYSSKSYITLFSYTPEGKFYHEVERIKDTYGYPHKKFSQYKVLNNSVYGNRKNKIGIRFYFKLSVDKIDKKIYLEIYDLNSNLLERNVYWDFDTIKQKIYRKMKILAFVKSYSKKIDGIEYFKYYDLKIYLLRGFDEFIELVDKGIVRINFKLNINTSLNKLGKIHDHGTSFDILEEDLEKLYIKI